MRTTTAPEGSRVGRDRVAVALVHWTFAPTTGGVESHLADLARLLAAAGSEVTVVTGEPTPTVTGDYHIVTTPLLDLQYVRAIPLGESADYMAALRRELRSMIADRRVEVVHGHNLHHFRPEPALVLDELRVSVGIKVHHTFHETWPDILADCPVYRAWSGAYAVSRFVQRQCHDRLGIEPRLLPLGVDLDRFQPVSPSRGRAAPAVVLHPARLLPWKGVHVSLAMLRRLLDEGLEVLMVITDTQRIADWNQQLVTYRRYLDQLIEANRLRRHVKLRSATYAEMPALYQEASVVVYPTVGEEPYGLVPLEAMASARPIVASRSGGIPETVVDGVTGFVVPPGDVEALADRVGRLLRDPALAQAFGVAGRWHVQRHFDARAYADLLLRLYREESSPIPPRQ